MTQANDDCLLTVRHFKLALLLGGPLAAAVVLSLNLWALKRRWLSFLFIVMGLTVSYAMELFSYSMSLLVVSYQDMGIYSAFIYRACFMMMAQFIFGLVIILFLRNRKIISTLNSTVYNVGFHDLIVIAYSFVYLFIHVSVSPLYVVFFNVFILLYFHVHLYFYRGLLYLSRNIFLKRIVGLLIFIVSAFVIYVYAFSRSLNIHFSDVILDFSDVYVFVVFYISLIWLVFEPLLLIVKYAGFVGRIHKTRRIIILVVIPVIAGLLIYGNLKFYDLKINKYQVHLQEEINGAQDTIRIAFIADLHFSRRISDEYLENFTKLIENQNPDVLMLGGDIIEMYEIQDEGELDRLDSALLDIDVPMGRYYVGGNHDRLDFSGYRQDFDGFVLSDTVMNVDDSFYLMGLKYRNNSRPKPISKLMPANEEKLPVILLDHSPYQLDKAVEAGIDIQLSGHTHNGQIWPLNYVISWIYELPWGYKKIGHTHFFVTSGIRGWGAPIRSAGDSEIMIIDLIFN
ncbi:MAG: hypothetical protein C0594_09490 [Marinilabiliales bacterium]|nr:MAG: hypothetical protein C0594_09490 [Marinilabiliales bacterium]